MKPRHQFYLDPPIQKELDQLCREPGTTRSAIVNAALRSYFAAKGASELERMFRMRLERMSEALDRLERNQHVTIESLALFIRYELGITPPLPANEQAMAQSLGRDRFHHFLEQVSRRMAGPKRIADEVLTHPTNNAERTAAE